MSVIECVRFLWLFVSNMHNLKEKRFILDHGFRGSVHGWAASRQKGLVKKETDNEKRAREEGTRDPTEFPRAQLRDTPRNVLTPWESLFLSVKINHPVGLSRVRNR